MDARRRLAQEDEDDDPSPFEAAPDVAANKIARFEGQKRKSKFERDREAEAERARKEAEEAARAYDDFVAAFGGEDEEGPSTGGRPRVGSVRTSGKGFVRAGGEEKYNPLAAMGTSGITASTSTSAAPSIPTGPKISTGPKATYGRSAGRPTAMKLMDDDEPETASKPLLPPSKKKREGDNFLEQLKRDQAAREERLKMHAGRTGASITALAAREHAPVLTGSYDQGDPLTTNLHVGGLPANVTEDSLGKLFAQFGPVGSVKIMWPRMETGQINTAASTGFMGRKLGGFVAFLRRPDAEKAAKEMDGAEWGDSILRIGWGKAVAIAATAIYEPEGGARRGSDRSTRRRRSRSTSHSRSRSRSRSPDDPHEFLRSKRARPTASRSVSPSRSRSQAAREWPALEEGVEEKFLVTVAKKVRDHGKSFEEILREREKENKRFAFLRDESLPSYHYFRMLVDPNYEPPSKAKFEDEGNADVYSSDSSEGSEQERLGKGKLGKLALKRFEALLRGLTSTREKIARGMAFALEHADCAALIADTLVLSLTIDSTPVPRKLARLHLVSDILHNASASLPNAWVYRSIFEARLPTVFDHLGDVYLSFPGRMKAEQFRGMIEKVIDVWDKDWLLFEPSVIEDFKRRLAGLDSVPPSQSGSPAPPSATMDIDTAQHASFSLPKSGSTTPALETPGDQSTGAPPPPPTRGGFKSSFKAASFTPAEAKPPSPAPAALDEDIDGAAVELDDLGGAAMDGEDVDGAPLGEDIDGERVVAQEDIDGVPMSITRVEDKEQQREATVLGSDGEDGEAMQLASDDDDIFQ
ncbi:hypothetical protein JCM21900_004153 [Sporobolomyces salmonicolor]